jgi:hypothetical protein
MTTITLAYRPAIAPVGAFVRIRIAAILVRDEGAYGRLLDYCGAQILIHQSETTLISKENHLWRIETEAVVLAHDGRVSYLVEVDKMRIRVHECNIVVVL